MNTMNMPGFTAEASLYRPTQSYRAGASGIPSALSSLVMPQALRGGSFGSARMIHWDCNIFGDCCATTEHASCCCFGPPYNECICIPRTRA
jgi:hypothetical protein